MQLLRLRLPLGSLLLSCSMDEMGKEEEEEELRKADCPKCRGDFIQNTSKHDWIYHQYALFY